MEIVDKISDKTNSRKRLEDYLSEPNFVIAKQLCLMAELDPSELVRKAARKSLFRTYGGAIRGTTMIKNQIYANVIIENVIELYYVCQKEPYILREF